MDIVYEKIYDICKEYNLENTDLDIIVNYEIRNKWNNKLLDTHKENKSTIMLYNLNEDIIGEICKYLDSTDILRPYLR